MKNYLYPDPYFSLKEFKLEKPNKPDNRSH